MSEIIVKSKTEIAKASKTKDILASYGVPEALDSIVKKEKSNILNMLDCGAVVADSINKISNSEEYFVEIPKRLREALKNGTAEFDKSGKNIGSFTPNIRIKGESGIKGQATISKGVDSQAITQSLANLAMMAMVQSVLEKLDAIEDKLGEIVQGQKNDRIGKILGAFKALMDLYPTFKSEGELYEQANRTYTDMQEGLTQLHLQIEEARRKLSSAPSNYKELVKQKILKNPFSNPFKPKNVDYYKELYTEFTYDIQLYNRLILLSDVVLHLKKGDSDVMLKNHRKMYQYCMDNLDCRFRQAMRYIMDRPITEIYNIDNYNKNYYEALDGITQKDILIEYNKEDVKLLNLKDYETK